MNYLQIKEQRINLDALIRYYPEDQKYPNDPNRSTHTIRFVSNDGLTFTITFQENRTERDSMIAELDIITGINSDDGNSG